MAMLPSHQHRFSADIDNLLDSHPSLTASLEDFEHDDTMRSSPLFGIPSQHSGFRSEPSESEPESEPPAPWSPPAWRKHASGWYQQNRFTSDSRSPSHDDRHSSYESAASRGYGHYDDEGDLTIPANIPLPISPEKNTPRSTAEPEGDDEMVGSPSPGPLAPLIVGDSRDASLAPQDTANNYIRFAVRAEVQHRTEPFEAAFTFVKEKIDFFTHSWTSTICSIIVGLIVWTLLSNLFSPPHLGEAPDLVKAAGLVRSFEPLITYSEHGVQQVTELQDTGVAVWDLAESVRQTNMTSAPIIVAELDDLSGGLKTLAIELTRFFANVNGDVDSILIVIDWAKRELTKAQTPTQGSFSAAFTNIHSTFCRLGLLEKAGKPTRMGKIMNDVFGQTPPQKTKAALQRTFNAFLNVLEESINQELTYSTLLFGLFESIERQFVNLARAVKREEDMQMEEEAEFLSSLWVQLVGPNANEVKKFARNKILLETLRNKTLASKSAVADHNGRLLMLKENLEVLRRKLISPLVRGIDSSLSIEEQVAGLEDTHVYLKGVREKQRTHSLDMLYSAGRGRTILGTMDTREIDGAF
ncbi:hypothetical protein NA57DRAFT_70065 [Rhizodiscina lignyota]|uniref:Uncharacterized protein n=1 Tax=Rhizodiscina lignyota TaxID=1504668 RepID=A0A9P4MAN2_9PEZI|nr:hypothetical protein NA57DRAFT_70065 [Rhizodiscina lignyota]